MQVGDDTQALLATLEDVMVREFRAYQSLLVVTKAERQALAMNDVPALTALVQQKEGVLRDLESLAQSRRQLHDTWVGGITTNALSELSAGRRASTSTVRRISRLRNGIRALAREVREINTGNRALAESALCRVEAVRAFLLSLDALPQGYLPPGAQPAKTPSTSYSLEGWA